MKGSLARSFAPVPLLGFLLLLLLVVFVPILWTGAASLLQRPTPTAAVFPTAALLPTSTPPPSATPTPAPPSVVRWRFQPAGETSTVPANRHATLLVTFDRPVAPEWVQDRLTFQPATSGQLSAMPGNIVAFTPDSGWQPDTSYAAHLAEAKALAGFSFYTPSFVFATLPSNGPGGCDPQEAVRLSFSYPVNPVRIRAALQVEPPTPYRLRWEGLDLVLEPDGGWALDTTYTVVLGAEAADAAGLPLGQPLRWSFTIRPGVLDFGPRGSASYYDDIYFAFDRPVDHASVEAALVISPAITGTFTWNENLVRFTFFTGARTGTLYLVKLMPTARAADGTPLLQHPLAWQFQFEWKGAAFDFGQGPNVQVLDAAGLRRVQFSPQWGREGTVPWLDFALYQVSPEQLLAAYSSSFKGKKPIDVAQFPLLRRWRVENVGEEVALPADVPPGLYVLTLEGPAGKMDGLLVVLTHYTLILKEAGVGVGSAAWHQVTGYASAIGSRQPRAGMAVRLYDRAGRLYAQGTTDEQGRFETAVPGDTDPLLALGEVDGELTLCGFGPEWNARPGGWWSWWGWQPNPPAGRRFRAYVYTDRPIYRPGQTVHVKAVVRADDDALYTLPPAGISVTVRLRDARDNVLATQVLAAGAFGTVHASFDLAEEGTLGTYNVEAVVAGEVTRQALKVEEYRKPDYEVTVSTDQAQYLQGQAITVTVQARYYFGQPAADVPVTVRLYKQGYDYYGDWGDEVVPRWEQLDRSYDGRTDARGQWQTRLVVPDLWYYDREVQTALSVEATVEDGSGQAVSGSTMVQVYKNRHGISLFLDRYAYAPGQEIPVDLLVRDYRGQPVVGAALRVGVYGWDGKAYSRVVVEAPVTTDSAGRAHTSLYVNEQGWYRLAASGFETAETWIWVYDPNSSAPWADASQDLQVSADKATYAVGDVAQLLVRSPVTGTALLSVERGRVRRMQPVQLTGLVTTIAVPIEADFAPNVFATVQVYRRVDPASWSYWQSMPDAELLIASTELVVPVPERRLQVTITPERETYAPRKEATVIIQVTDVAGRPVRAELSLAMVDEAIYALSQDLALDPFEAFYGRRSNLVRTYHSLEPTRELGGGDGRGGGGGGFSPGNPRYNFPDTAYWNPAIVTDEGGRAVVILPIPDSLTRWRLVARAVTEDTRLGEGTAGITVTQALVVRPALPRFLVQGDVLTVTATVHNYSGAAITATAGLQASGLDVRSPLTFTVGVAAGATAQLGWMAQATALGTITVTAYAAAADLGDAVQYNLPVIPYAVPEVQSWAGEFVGEQDIRFTLPQSFIPAVTQVEVRLAPSVVPTLLDGLEYLVGYPFG